MGCGIRDASKVHYMPLKPMCPVSCKYMVHTAKEMLFSRTFPGQNYHFPGQSIQDLKAIYQNMCENAYHIYSMYDSHPF